MFRKISLPQSSTQGRRDREMFDFYCLFAAQERLLISRLGFALTGSPIIIIIIIIIIMIMMMIIIVIKYFH